MPTNGEFNGELRGIVNHVDAVDDEVVEQVSGRTGSGEPVEGYACRRGDHQYRVLGCPVWEYFRITYEYDARQDEAVAMAAAEATDGQVEIELTDERIEAAHGRLVERADEETFADLELDLVRWLSQPECGLEIRADDAGRPMGFEVGRKAFVYEESFSAAAFERGVRAVVSLGLKGAQLCSTALGIEAVEAGGVPDAGEDTSRMFQ